MTNQQAPEALRLADEFKLCNEYDSIPSINDIAKAEAELRRLHTYCQELEAQVILDCMTNVQNPAEIEHGAGDVSKSGPESNMAQQPGAAYAAQDSEHQLAIMQGERNASLDAYSRVVYLTGAESRLYEAGFTNGWDRRDRLASHGQAPAQAAPELTETAVTAKNPAAPVSSFEDSRTQAVYEVLVNDNYPPAGSNEHWEGWKARLIVDALFPIEAPAHSGKPVAWLNPWRADQVTTDYDAYGEHGIALYTAPQPVEREPLTHAQAKALVLKYGNDPLHLVLQVERAHGIKGGQHGTK